MRRDRLRKFNIWGGRSTKFSKRSHLGAPRPGFEVLEDRRVLSAASLVGSTLFYGATPEETLHTSFDQVGGTLVIHDPVNVISAGPEFTVVSPHEVTIPVASVTWIVAHGSHGDDYIALTPEVMIDAELFGHSGDDTLIGGGGNDHIDGWWGNDTIDGGLGQNTAGFTGADLNITFQSDNQAISFPTGSVDPPHVDTFVNFQNMTINVQGSGDGVVDASLVTLPILFFDQGGNDTFIGGSGDDTFWLIGGQDNDIIDGGGGNDFVRFQDGSSSTIEIVGHSIVTGDKTLSMTNIESAWIVAGEGDNIIDASGFAGGIHLLVFAEGGNDTLIAGSGAIQLFGGEGDNLFVATSLADGTVFEGGHGNDVLDLTAITSDIVYDAVYHSNRAFLRDGPIAVDARGINTFLSGSGNDRLEGPFDSSTWNIIGPDTISLLTPFDFEGPMEFVGVENLAGKSGQDTFVFASGGSISGAIDGSHGFDTLDLSAVVGPGFVVAGAGSVDGQAGSASVVGSFDNIDMLLPDNQPPTFLSPAAFAVDENSTVVGSVVAADPDDDPLFYSLSGGADASLFAIDSTTGELTFVAPPDYETPLDAGGDNHYEVEVAVEDGNGGTASQTLVVAVENLASISGVVYLDTNKNQSFEGNELGLDGVAIHLADSSGHPVLDPHGDAIVAVTSDGGFYLFEDLAPGTYQLHQVQPSGVADGPEQLGSLGGTIVGTDAIELLLDRTDAFDYAFSEWGVGVASGDAAGIGYWQNKHGQALITSGGPALANWLTNTFGNIFGNSLQGADGSDVASFYKNQLFKQKAQKNSGPAKVDAQFMAVALATFFTNRSLAGNLALQAGFNVTDTGLGSRVVNVGNKGAAFGVANGTTMTVLQLLLATDGLTDVDDARTGFASIYDRDGDGAIDSQEKGLRSMANDLFSSINEQGGI